MKFGIFDKFENFTIKFEFFLLKLGKKIYIKIRKKNSVKIGKKNSVTIRKLCCEHNYAIFRVLHDDCPQLWCTLRREGEGGSMVEFEGERRRMLTTREWYNPVSSMLHHV